MKALVVYYSYTGRTRKAAGDFAKKRRADLVEVKEARARSKVNAYVAGSLAARGRRQVEIEPLSCDFALYDTITIVMPIWAGYPAPAINNVIGQLPPGKEVELVFTSGSGSSGGSAEGTRSLIEARGCKVTGYGDIKSADI